LANPPSNVANTVSTALLITDPGVAGQISNTGSANPDLIEITTFNAAGQPTDISFYISVLDLTP
jgi:hypothetical protein